MEDAGTEVLYDVEPREGNPKLYRYSATGKVHTFEGFTGFIHDVELSDLQPGKTYFFICGGKSGGYSEEKYFTTIPEDLKEIKFVASSDSQYPERDWDRINWPENRNLIFRTMASFKPSFLLHGGDIVRNGAVQWEWEDFFSSMENNLTDEEGMMIPIVPAMGNHELRFMSVPLREKEDAMHYFELFSLPNDEKWYSLDFGENFLHITVLNSEAYLFGEQLEWLENDLAASGAKWKIALFHSPPFVSIDNGNKSNLGVRKLWVPIFDKYHVDVVVSGHVHYYERTYPIDYTKSDNAPVEPSEGTIYFEVGSFGSTVKYLGEESVVEIGQRASTEPKWWTACSVISLHNFLLFHVTDNTMTIKAIDPAGNVFDEVSIVKPSAILSTPAESFSGGYILVAATIGVVSVFILLIILRKIRTLNPKSR